jgi:hypothetical protein
MRKSLLSSAPLACLVLSAATMFGCSNPDDDPLGCGEGTERVGHECLPKNRDAGPDAEPGSAPSFGGVTSVSPVSGSALQVTWDAAADGITKKEKLIYRVYASATPSGQNFKAPIATTPAGVTHININGLAPADSTWYVVVRAVNEAGQEDTNTVEKSAKASSDKTAPIFGGITAAAPDPGGGVKVSWDPATDEGTPKEGITYLIYYSEKADASSVFSAPLIITEPGAAFAIVKGLPKPKTDYYFGVRARDAAGNLETNKVTKASQAGPDTAPPVFSGCTGAAAKDAGSITVNWNAAVDDTTPATQIVYDIFKGTSAGTEDFSKPIASFTGGTTGLVVGLTSKTTYYFVCRARDLSGNSDKNTFEVFDTTAEDSEPPTFGGVTGSKDIGGDTVTLTYAAATDNKSAPEDITYTAYASKVSQDDAVAKPSVATVKGKTEVVVTGLETATKYFFVVRAKDAANNSETNTKFVNASTLISFKLNIQPIFDRNCAVSGCHVLPTPPQGMVLSSGFAYTNTVGVVSVENTPMERIHAGDPENSYLYRKITGRPASGTNAMPPPGATSLPTTEEKDRIKEWITEGALNN